jgi:hypothetical protein
MYSFDLVVKDIINDLEKMENNIDLYKDDNFISNLSDKFLIAYKNANKEQKKDECRELMGLELRYETTIEYCKIMDNKTL